MSELEGFELVDMRSRNKKVVRVAPLAKESRLTLSRWLLEQVGIKLGAVHVSVRRKGNVLALTAGKTSFVDNSYSQHRVRIHLPKDLFVPGKPFNCHDVTLAAGVAYITLPPDKMLPEVE